MKTSIYKQLVVQIIFLFLTALIMDFGVIKRCFQLSMIIFWTLVLLSVVTKTPWPTTNKWLFHTGVFIIFFEVYFFITCLFQNVR